MNSSSEVIRAFIDAALLGKWVEANQSIDGPYVLYITPDQAIVDNFLQDVIAEVEHTQNLSIDRHTTNFLSVCNLDGILSMISVGNSRRRLYALRSYTCKRPSVLIGTGLDRSDAEKELFLNMFLPSLNPTKCIVDLGGAYDM